MSLSDLEQHVLADYLAVQANDLNIATRWYPYGKLALILKDKFSIAVRKFGIKARGRAKPVVKAFLEHLIEKGVWATKQNEFGGRDAPVPA